MVRLNRFKDRAVPFVAAPPAWFSLQCGDNCPERASRPAVNVQASHAGSKTGILPSENNYVRKYWSNVKHYHDDLWPNVLTYIHGWGFGIGVFERLEQDEFNPNVSLEVGYLYGLGKSVCLLKDKTLKTLHTDLVGKLYRPFDPQAPATTIPPQLSKWLADKGIRK